jgi:hypothetical protein
MSSVGFFLRKKPDELGGQINLGLILIYCNFFGEGRRFDGERAKKSALAKWA